MRKALGIGVLIALGFLLLTSCAVPTTQSARPTGMEVRADGGKAHWFVRTPVQSDGDANTWNVGVSMYWKFQYDEGDDQ